MFQDPRSLSFLVLPAVSAVSAVAAVLVGTGSVNLEASLHNGAPDLAYIEEADSVEDTQDTAGAPEEALPPLTIPLAPTTTGPPPSTGAPESGDTAPATGAPTTGGTNPGSPTAPSPAPTPTPKAPDTSPPPSAAPSTEPPTTGEPTTKPPTTAPTTAPPTPAPPTTKTPATEPAPTNPPSTAPPSTQPVANRAPIIGVLIEGESTSDPNGGWNNYPADVAANLGTSVAVKVDGLNGVRADQINAEGSKAHLLTPGTGHNVAVLWVGINDISQARQPADVYNQISTWATNRRNEGWDRIVLVTVTKFEHPNSLATSGSHEAADQKRQELNNLIAGNGAGADAIVDLRNAEGIGDGYSVHDTNWRPDKIHLSQLGNQRVAGSVAAAVQSLGS